MIDNSSMLGVYIVDIKLKLILLLGCFDLIFRFLPRCL